jgi:nitrate reductase NapE component
MIFEEAFTKFSNFLRVLYDVERCMNAIISKTKKTISFGIVVLIAFLPNIVVVGVFVGIVWMVSHVTGLPVIVG